MALGGLCPCPILAYFALHTPRDGLAGMQCTSIFRDSRGLVWVGTKTGLSRFNGETFENFHLKDGLLSEYTTIIGEDSKGHLWFNCAFRGLLRFDGRTFKPFMAPNLDFNSSVIGQNDEIIAVSGGKPYHIVGNSLVPLRWRGVPARFYTHNDGIFYHKTTNSYLCTIGDSMFVYKNQQLRFLQSPSYGRFSNQTVIYGDVHLQRDESNIRKYVRWNGQILQHFLTAPTGKEPQLLATLPCDFFFDHNGKNYLLNRNSRRPETINAFPVNAVEYGGAPNNPPAIRYLATEKGLLGLVKNGFESFTEEQVPYAWSVVKDRKRQWEIC